MPHFLITVEMHYRQMFLVEAESEEQAKANYADGEQSDYFHTEPEIIAVELVEPETGAEQLSLFGNE
jgi:hypothetical protein